MVSNSCSVLLIFIYIFPLTHVFKWSASSSLSLSSSYSFTLTTFSLTYIKSLPFAVVRLNSISCASTMTLSRNTQLHLTIRPQHVEWHNKLIVFYHDTYYIYTTRYQCCENCGIENPSYISMQHCLI